MRGLAILCVLMSHFVPALADVFGTSWSRQLVSYAGPGAWGVDVFFVLSGFLITGILLDTRKSPDYWCSFYGRRALRIFPLYYVFLIGLYLHQSTGGGSVEVLGPSEQLANGSGDLVEHFYLALLVAGD